MPTNLITVATVTNSAEAQFVANRLKDAGIESAIADDNVVTMDFLFGNAVGWIKVQVREQDADKAEELLAAIEPPASEDEIPWDEPPENADEEDKADPEERARKIEERKAPVITDLASAETELLLIRAYRQSIIGLFLFPPVMNLFSLRSLKKVSDEESERLSETSRRRASLALMINFFSIIAFGWIWIATVIYFIVDLAGGW